MPDETVSWASLKVILKRRVETSLTGYDGVILSPFSGFWPRSRATSWMTTMWLCYSAMEARQVTKHYNIAQLISNFVCTHLRISTKLIGNLCWIVDLFYYADVSLTFDAVSHRFLCTDMTHIQLTYIFISHSCKLLYILCQLLMTNQFSLFQILNAIWFQIRD